jgi:hypothetical protein
MQLNICHIAPVEAVRFHPGLQKSSVLQIVLPGNADATIILDDDAWEAIFEEWLQHRLRQSRKQMAQANAR